MVPRGSPGRGNDPPPLPCCWLIYCSLQGTSAGSKRFGVRGQGSAGLRSHRGFFDVPLGQGEGGRGRPRCPGAWPGPDAICPGRALLTARPGSRAAQPGAQMAAGWKRPSPDFVLERFESGERQGEEGRAAPTLLPLPTPPQLHFVVRSRQLSPRQRRGLQMPRLVLARPGHARLAPAECFKGTGAGGPQSLFSAPCPFQATAAPSWGAGGKTGQLASWCLPRPCKGAGSTWIEPRGVP